MNAHDASLVKIGDVVVENGARRTVLAIEHGRIEGPHFRLSGYDAQPGCALTSYSLCAMAGCEDAPIA